MNTAYENHLTHLGDAWKGEQDEGADTNGKQVIPDGGSVRVSITAMDSTQRAAFAMTSDHLTDQEREEGARVAAWEAHYTQQREAQNQAAQDANPALAAYIKRTSQAWEHTL